MTALRVFIPFALGFFVSYVFRVVNAVIAPDLTAELGLDAADLGLLTSAYFLTFAAFQIPLGILLDRYGPKRTEVGLLAFAALGALVFSRAEGMAGLVVGRALIGLGVSSCLMAAFTAYVSWFPKERLPLLNGCQMAFGGLGALTATAPVEWALGFTDWRGLFAGSAVFTLLVAALITAVVPRETVERVREPASAKLQGITHVFTSAVFWRIAPITVASQATFLAIQGLWSGPWLRDVGGLDRSAAADHLFLIALCMVAGMAAAGWITDRLGRIGISTMTSVVAFTAVFMVGQTVIAFNWADPILLPWLAFGLFGNTGVLAFAALSQSFPRHLAGRVVTALNLLAILGAWAAQWGMGLIINLWPALPSGGYPPPAYRAAFLLMLALQVLAVAWYAAFRHPPVKSVD